MTHQGMFKNTLRNINFAVYTDQSIFSSRQVMYESLFSVLAHENVQHAIYSEISNRCKVVPFIVQSMNERCLQWNTRVLINKWWGCNDGFKTISRSIKENNAVAGDPKILLNLKICWELQYGAYREATEAMAIINSVPLTDEDLANIKRIRRHQSLCGRFGCYISY